MLSFLAGSLLWKSLTGGGLLSRALGHAALDLEAFGKWLFADAWRLVAFALAIALALSALHGRHWKHIATDRQAQLVTCNATRDADRAAYIKAQADAKALNDAQLARVKSEQQGITTHVEQTYEGDLARLRAELARLLAQPAAKGAPGSSTAPELPNAAPVPDDPSRVSVPTGLYVRGAELELQLEALQNWVRQQVAVDPNK